MTIEPFYIIFVIMPIVVLLLTGYYAYSCWGEHFRGEGFSGGITFIEWMCVLAAMLLLTSGAEEGLNIMALITAGVVTMIVLRLINSLVGWIVARKLQRRSLSSPK